MIFLKKVNDSEHENNLNLIHNTKLLKEKTNCNSKIIAKNFLQY